MFYQHGTNTNHLLLFFIFFYPLIVHIIIYNLHTFLCVFQSGMPTRYTGQEHQHHASLYPQRHSDRQSSDSRRHGAGKTAVTVPARVSYSAMLYDSIIVYPKPAKRDYNLFLKIVLLVV